MSAVAPLAPYERASRRLMTRLLARQRRQREGTVRRLGEREMVTFRRALYRCSVRVRGVAGGNGNQQQRDITAESFRRNPTHLNRLRPWLRRELTVLYGAHASLVDIVQRIIMARLARHGLEDTPTVEEELRPFLLARTDHFLHELVSFARSPLSLESYDATAVYEPPDAISSSSDDDSIIAISEGEEEQRPAGGRAEEAVVARRGGALDDVIQAGSCLSLAAWDDETPGPSYSSAEPSCSLASPPFSSGPQEAANEERGEKRQEAEEEEECLIVGYKKPIAERTPELVQLSSDTEEDEEKKKKKEEAESLPAPPPAATPPLSYLPTIPPSTSGAYEQDDAPKEKDGEVVALPPRARSWSCSSGRSRKSVCTLSPATPGATPGASERRRERNRKSSCEKRRRKKKKRRKGRERSGTMFNPNRSIYPAMMRRRSPSPFHSSVESGSPLPPPSPPDSAWEFHGAHISPLTSSASSPSRSSSTSSLSSSSSPLCSPPQPASRTTPIPSASPDHHGEKPGGKRKYKSRHLDSDDKDPTWRPREKRREKEERRRRRGRRKERRAGGESSKRSRVDRSPSVEIIYEGTISAALSPARKRRRKRHRRTQQSSSPVIITLDSDSSHDDGAKNVSSVSSSPLSSQQTVDFSDLPPLPLPAPSSSAIGAAALNAEIGELPVDILDRGSDGSDAEPSVPIAVDNSDHDVDVENVEEGESASDDGGEGPMTTKDTKTRGGDAAGATTTTTRQRDSEFSDSRLLATILNDLKGFAADCKPPGEQPADDIFGIDLPSVRTGIRPPPPLERLREEVKDVPPLLKQASPVRSYNRNTPPPLKHKDAGSPHPSPALPHHAGANSHVDVHSNPAVDSRLGDAAVAAAIIPPVSTPKRNVTDALAPAGDLVDVSASIDSHSPSKAGALSASSRHKPSSSSSGHLSHLDLNSFHSVHSRTNKATPASLKSASVDLHAVNYFPDFPPGWSNEKPAHADSTSRGCRDMSPTSRLLAPVDLHPSDVFSGVARNDTSLPVFVSSLHPRTRDISSSVDSHSSGTMQNSSTAPGVTLSPVDVHPGSPGHTGDLQSSSAARLTDNKASSVVNHGKRSPYGRPPPVDLHPPSPPAGVRRSSVSAAAAGHLNHAALSSAPFQASRRISSSSDPVDSHSKLLGFADAKLHNHFDPRSDASFHVDVRTKHNRPVGFRRESLSPVDSHPKHSGTDNHDASSRPATENRWNAIDAIDASDSRTPETKRDPNV